MNNWFSVDFVWYLKIVLSCSTSFGIGWSLVSTFRKICINTDKMWKLISLVFVIPFSVYIFLYTATRYSLCDRVVADAFSFGIVMGMLINLTSPPTGKVTVKLVAHQIKGKHHSVWLDSLDALVGDARNKLSETLDITPSSRINIESGRGSYLEDMNSKLIPQLGDSSLSKDFFGFTTAQCYIDIIEPQETNVSHFYENQKGVSPFGSFSNKNNNTSNKPGRSFMGLTQNVCYGKNVTLTAKVFLKKSDRDVRALMIASIEKFAAAAPVKDLGVGQTVQIRFKSFNIAAMSNNGKSIDGNSEVDFPTNYSVTSKQSSPRKDLIKYQQTNTNSNYQRGSINVISNATNMLLRKGVDGSMNVVRNGDVIVLESEGK